MEQADFSGIIASFNALYWLAQNPDDITQSPYCGIQL